MKTKLIIVVVFASLCGYSQTEILKSSISSGGDNVEVGNLKLIYTIGENAIQENESGTLQLSEGFLSPIPVGVVLGTEDFLELTGITAYPNPTTDFVNLRFSELSDYEIKLFDVSGRQLSEFKTSQTNFKVDLKSFLNGVYFMNVSDAENGKSKVFRILKN